MRAILFFAVAVVAAFGMGCMHQEEDDYYPAPALDLSLPSAFDLAQPPAGDGGSTVAPPALGSGRARPAETAALHVGAGASVTVPDGTYGFIVTANGAGGYRVGFVDAANAGLRYHGSVFTDGSFDQVTSVGMSYATVSGQRLDFQSQPGVGQVGYVDMVPSTDPIVVDVLAGAMDGVIYYVDGAGITRSVPTPATFTSP